MAMTVIADEQDDERGAITWPRDVSRPPRLLVLLSGLLVLGVRVEALRGELAHAAIPQLHRQEQVVAESVHGVDRDQREPPVGHRRLIDRLAVELGGDRDRAADQRQAPDQGDVAAAAAVGAPPADHVVVEVDLPVGVVRRR